MSPSDPQLWTALVIGLAVLVGVIRLLLWQRAAPVEARAPHWRIGVLIGLQVICAALLWLTLFPPAAVIRSGALIVATRGAPVMIARSLGDILIALPEAGPIAEAVRVPDLATAFRRYPRPANIRVIGQGLTPRDRIVMPAPLTFDPLSRPRGLTDLALPGPVAPGATISVGGQVGALPTGTVELLDPAGTVVDRTPALAGGRFVLNASARAPGLALFALRVRDAAGTVVEQVAVPVETRDQAPPKVLVLAGAPGPETKFLGRWAEDAGIELAVDIDVGAGVRLGDPPVALTRATLGERDLVVIDDRRWESLGAGGQAALREAVANGMGLLLRPTGPLSAATRRDWAGLGVSLRGGDESLPLQLDPTEDSATVDPAAETPEADDEAEALPELARRDLALDGPNAISIVRDGDGVALASWRGLGRGRVGVWTVTDSYALILTGRADRYGEMWSELFSALARAGDDSRAAVDGLPRVGARIALCRLEGAATVQGPDGPVHQVQMDPATGDRACAAFWPGRAGWHIIRDGEGRETAFYAHPAEAAPSLIAAADREATLALAASSGPDGRTASTSRAPGSPWPWFIGLLLAAAALWWFERQRSPGPRDTAGQFARRTMRLRRG
ncbi:MAG: hypothetical protein V4701_03155 [Pseudomonadota bacterium]